MAGTGTDTGTGTPTGSGRTFPSSRSSRWCLTALCLGFAVVQLDAAVVNVGLASIRRDLGGGLGGQQWVVASYTVVLAAGMLTAGALGDRFGARRVCVGGLVVFAAGSGFCAFAPALPVLIGAYVVAIRCTTRCTSRREHRVP